MECSRAHELLVEQVFGEIDAADGMDLARHLASCSVCAEEERELMSLRELGGAAGEVSASLRARVRSALAPRSPWEWLRRPVPAYAMFVAVALGAVVAFLPTRWPRAAAPSPPVARPVEPDHAVVPFAVAESYGTAVGAVRLVEERDSSRAESPRRDSL